MKKLKHWVVFIILTPIAFILIFTHSRALFFRVDLTGDGRYSLSEPAKELLAQTSEPLTLRLYLNGNLDANTARLRRNVIDIVQEINAYSAHRITIENYDPNEGTTQDERYAEYERLESRGLYGMNITQSANGRISEQIIFPWAELCSSHDTMAVRLFSTAAAPSGEEAINNAIEDTEFQLIDAIRVLNRNSFMKIAFIEGHDELDEEYVYDACDALSRYFQIDRGRLGYDPNMLDPYAAIIIAKPQTPFTEAEKFIIDQYIMRGGRVLWLVDGAKTSNDLLASGGQSPIIALDCNLNDMLFRYGVRITPSAIEDMQCAYMPVNMARPGQEARFEPIPWFFTPLLQTNPNHPITKSVSNVKADFASGIELVGDTMGVTKTPLLASSNATHVHFAPSEINVNDAIDIEPEKYFYTAYVPIGVLLEGSFTSVFQYRMVPDSVEPTPIIARSEPTRMIVVGDGDIIRNDIEKHKEGLMLVPLGYDRVTRQTHGNRDFIVNAMLYLTDDSGLMALRNRQVDLHLLNRAYCTTKATAIKTVSIAVPLLLLALMGGILLLIRKKQYSK